MAEQQKVFPTPVDWDELYPGRFIKAVDLKGKKVTLKIAGVKLEELIGDKGPQIKGLISFEGKDKQLALNKTNGICLKEMFGKKLAEWTGKRVTLFPTTYNDDDCIRIWGSPDIEADREVMVALPRKRPFKMTMHRVDRQNVSSSGAANSNGAPGRPPSEEESLKTLRGAETRDALAAARKSVWALYAAAGAEVPLNVEATANERADSLEQDL
jgi:hypothetical protein